MLDTMQVILAAGALPQSPVQ